MPTADTARLIASLELDDRKFNPGLTRAIGSVDKLDSRLKGHLNRGISSLATNLTRAGIAAGVGLAGGLALGVRSLANLQRVEAQTAAVIKSTGGAAGQTVASIRAHAQALEDVTTADDKAIEEGQNMLLTFTNIGKNVFPAATKAVVDLSIAMADGNVENADFGKTAIQVGKALNDPIKGITALSRVGVSFTKQQKEQIATLVKAGKTEEAQKIILAELTREFGKAGAAAGTGPEAAFRRLEDAGEDLSQSLARSVLPALERGARFLSTKLKDPATIKFMDDLGRSIGKVADEALDFVEGVDWSSVGNGIRGAADIAKGIVGAFMGLPDWVKTAVVTGWGLNKLTGGAAGSIVAELGKGLIKGVLGMNAAVVNINAGVVNRVGVPAVPGAAAGGLTAGAIIKGGIKFVLPIAAGVLIANAIRELAGITPEQGAAQQSKGQFGPRTQGQADARKTEADLEAARAAAVFADGSYDAAEKIKGAANAASGGLTGTADAARKAYRQLLADRQALEKGRGKTGRVAFVGGGSNASAIAGANYLAQKFATSQKPFYQNMSNAARSLSALKALQARFLARGDVRNAALVGRDIKIMQRVIAQKAQAVKDATTTAGEKARRAGNVAAGAIRNKKMQQSVTVNTNVVQTTVIDGRKLRSSVGKSSVYQHAS